MPENKFEPLRDYLLKEKRIDFVLTFEEIEEILGFGCRAARSAPSGGTTTRCTTPNCSARPSAKAATTRGGRRTA